MCYFINQFCIQVGEDLILYSLSPTVLIKVIIVSQVISISIDKDKT